MLGMTFPFCSDVVITHLINLQVSFTCSFLVHLILGLSASSLVTLQSRLMCCLCKPFPPQKPHILLVVLLRITYDHTHLEVDLHPAKTMQFTQRSYWSGSLKAEYKYSEHLWSPQFQATQGKIITICFLI